MPATRSIYFEESNMSFSDLVNKMMSGHTKGKISMPGVKSSDPKVAPNTPSPKLNTHTSSHPVTSPQVSGPMKWKAGGFPFYMNEKGKLMVCLFKSNDPLYGGKAPQMPKGHPDPGEAPGQAAAREAMEETGIPTRLLYQNRIQVGKVKFRGETSTYIQYVYAFPLEKKFPATSNDEGMGKWYDYEYALTVIRKDQKSFLKMARAAAVKYYGNEK